MEKFVLAMFFSTKLFLRTKINDQWPFIIVHVFRFYKDYNTLRSDLKSTKFATTNSLKFRQEYDLHNGTVWTYITAVILHISVLYYHLYRLKY